MSKIELNQTIRSELTLGGYRYVMKCLRTRTDTVLVHFYGANIIQSVLINTAANELKVPRHHIVLVKEGIIERMEEQLTTESALENADSTVVDFSRMADLTDVFDKAKNKQAWSDAKFELTALVKKLEHTVSNEPGHLLTHEELMTLVNVALAGVQSSEYPLRSSIKGVK